jgi:hypothetical protein
MLLAGNQSKLRASGIARRRTEPGWRAAVLDERADTLFVCERVRKAAATECQPQRAERAMSEEGAEALFPLRATTTAAGSERDARAAAKKRIVIQQLD